jgi:exopolysaccharide production protein ExoZ
MPRMDYSRNRGIQLARAIAALTVAYFHSYIALRGFPESAQVPIGPLKDWGYLGVDFFFAISGYVICLLGSKPNFSPVPFAIKRIFRIFPMYWVVMAAVATLITLHLFRPETLGHFLYSASLLPQQHASVYDPSWTLEREMVFYLLATLILPFAGTVGLAIVLAALAIAGWYFGDPWSYHLISTRHADFLAGVVVFLIGGSKRFGLLVTVIGIAALILTRDHDFVFAIPICMGCILFGMIELELPWHRRPLIWLIQIGDASYSVYLLHVLLFTAASYVAVHFVVLPDWLCEFWRYGAIGLCCVISSWTWRTIELPAIRYGNRLTRQLERSSGKASVAIAPDSPLPGQF